MEEGPTTRRIVLLGKSGNGKSSLANTIFGENVFEVKKMNDPNKSTTQAETRCVDGRNLTLIDTPGLFDAGKPGKNLDCEKLRCTAECAPGPHVFLILLKVEKFTEHERSIVRNICQHFSEDILKRAAVVFTHGDQLPGQTKIDDYVAKSEGLKSLVDKCQGRCHVFDNKYWKGVQQDGYRSNQFQVAELLTTIDSIVTENGGAHYTNETFQEMESAIQQEVEQVSRVRPGLSQEQIRRQAISNIVKKKMYRRILTWKNGAVSFISLSVCGYIVYISVVEPGKVLPAVSGVAEAVTEATSKVTTDSILDAWEAIFDKFWTLYDITFNPYNPFE